MKIHLYLLTTSLLFLSACATTSDSVPTLSQRDCSKRVEKCLEFGTLPGQTRDFIHFFANNPNTDLEVLFEALGKNISSTMLVMKDPYAQQISLRINPDMDAFTNALNNRIFRGESMLQMKDVVDMQMQGDFLRVQVEAPQLVSGYFFVMCKEVEGRTLPEQTFVNYFRRGEGPAKISIEALVGLLM